MPPHNPFEASQLVGISPADRGAITSHYRILASAAHPDRDGGSHAQMSELNQARDEALKECS